MQGRVRRGWTSLSRVNASTWHLQSFFLKPPFDLHVTGSLGEELILRCCSLLFAHDLLHHTQGPEKKTKERSMLFSGHNRSLLRQQPRSPGGSADNLITGCSELHCQHHCGLLALTAATTCTGSFMLLHSSTCLSSCCSADCRRAIGLGQASDIVLKLKPARQNLKEQVDVLSQQPLAASPHFFSLKAPDPTQQEIVAVPARTSPPPAGKLTLSTRAQVSCCMRHGMAQPTWLS